VQPVAKIVPVFVLGSGEETQHTPAQP